MNKSKGIILGIVIILVVIGGWVAVKSFLAVESPFYIVSSESMVPNLERGDVIIQNQ